MIVGIAGGMCSGKDTVAGILRDDHSFLLVNSSDIVRRELRSEGTEISRANQRLLQTRGGGISVGTTGCAKLLKPHLRTGDRTVSP